VVAPTPEKKIITRKKKPQGKKTRDQRRGKKVKLEMELGWGTAVSKRQKRKRSS